MSFEDRFGVTKIIDARRDNLSVSFDKGTRRIADNDVGVVFLYTPDMQNTNTHYHIDLTKEEAIKLKNWLDSFLNESSMVERYDSDLERRKK
jgi:hypothetical protein